MTYGVQFLPSAQKAWKTLGRPAPDPIKAKRAERLAHPRMVKDALRVTRPSTLRSS
jgi:hypothetical protein